MSTRGNGHVVDITGLVKECLDAVSIRDGVLTLFVVGSTAGITTTEFEPGLVNHDLAEGFERIAPADADYIHEQTWNDDNGHSHVRASVLGPGLTIPISKGVIPLGTWQQIVLIDFDTRPRNRQVVCQIMGT